MLGQKSLKSSSERSEGRGTKRKSNAKKKTQRPRSGSHADHLAGNRADGASSAGKRI